MFDKHTVAQEFADARADALEHAATLIGDINCVHFGERAPHNGDPAYVTEVVEALSGLYLQAVTDTVNVHRKHSRKAVPA